jgi:hypothetical protein
MMGNATQTKKIIITTTTNTAIVMPQILVPSSIDLAEENKIRVRFDLSIDFLVSF